MFRNYLLLLVLTIGLFTLPGCSLFSSDKEESDDTVAEAGAEEGEGSDSEVEEIADDEEVVESDEDSSTDEVALSEDEEEVVDEYPDDDYGDEADTATAANDLPDKPVETEPATTSDDSLFAQGEESEPATESRTSEDTSSSLYSDNSLDSNVTQGFVPVRKMKRTPYNAGGVLLNRLYVARAGDSMSSVSQKIYGDSGREKDLLAWNSHFQGKDLKVGDKVYYNSPKNPSDSSQILMYYEDVGLQPQYYTSKSGDSIRKVSQNLLGHPNSWMEIWATNEVESKWQMPDGTSLRYWPDGSSAPAPTPVQQAQVQEEPPPVVEEAPAPEQQSVTTAETDAMEAPAEETPPTENMPEGEGDMGAAAQVAQNEPPPPPADMSPPPPPAPVDNMAATDTAGEEDAGLAGLLGGQDDTTMIAALGGLLLVAAFILLIFLKRGRKKVNYG